jgi:hypothetical protein
LSLTPSTRFLGNASTPDGRGWAAGANDHAEVPVQVERGLVNVDGGRTLEADVAEQAAEQPVGDRFPAAAEDRPATLQTGLIGQVGENMSIPSVQSP